MAQVQTIETRNHYAAYRAGCTYRLVTSILTGERKGTGPAGKKVLAALQEYDKLIGEQLKKPLEMPTSSS